MCVYVYISTVLCVINIIQFNIYIWNADCDKIEFSREIDFMKSILLKNRFHFTKKAMDSIFSLMLFKLKYTVH